MELLGHNRKFLKGEEKNSLLALKRELISKCGSPSLQDAEPDSHLFLPPPEPNVKET